MKCPYARDYENGQRATCSLHCGAYPSCHHSWDGENNCGERYRQNCKENGWFQNDVNMEGVIRAMDERTDRMVSKVY